jgi:hypothetical protein
LEPKEESTLQLQNMLDRGVEEETPPYCGERDMGTIDAAEVRLTEDEISELGAAIP